MNESLIVLLIGFIMRSADTVLPFLTESVHSIFDILGKFVVIALLFRIGLSLIPEALKETAFTRVVLLAAAIFREIPLLMASGKKSSLIVPIVLKMLMNR